MSVVLVPTPNSTTDITNSTFVTNVMAAGGLTVTSAQSAIMDDLITAASNEINRYCNRVFPLNRYSEIVTPEGGRQDRGEPANVDLTMFPIVNVVSVLTSRQTAMWIQNTDPVANQLAWVGFITTGDILYYDLVYTGINLTRVTSGTTHTDSLFFQNYTTLNALATAVNALGHGWSANVLSVSGANNVGLFPTANLVGVREPKSAFQPGAGLDLFVTPATSFDINRQTGTLRCFGWSGYGWGGNGGWGDPWNNTYDGLGGWGGGQLSWVQYSVTYDAGFSDVPLGIQMVCAEVVKLMYARLLSDPSLKSETTGAYQWTAKDSLANLSEDSMRTLNLWKNWCA